jgi:hypothetical protein
MNGWLALNIVHAGRWGEGGSYRPHSVATVRQLLYRYRTILSNYFTPYKYRIITSRYCVYLSTSLVFMLISEPTLSVQVPYRNYIKQYSKMFENRILQASKNFAKTTVLCFQTRFTFFTRKSTFFHIFR